MARSGGFPGMGGGNMQQMMRQAQKMQQKMAELQAELETREFEASSGGGMVTAVINGKKEVLRLTIDPKAVDPDDVDMLQDMVIAAINEALRSAEETTESEMGKITGGISMPGLF